MAFKDHFSTQASAYRDFRPQYPDALFSYLATQTSTHQVAWDCGCGNGQAAVSLAKHFEHVIATDASAKQIEQQIPHNRVEYRVVPAEQSELDDQSIDLVTVALALHWFDHARFYTEVQRVLKPGGILAVWCNQLLRGEAAINELIDDYYQNIVGPYWPAERRSVENGYRDLDFPFEEIEPPAFEMVTHWDRNQLMGYLGSWSASQYYQKQNHNNPLHLIDAAMKNIWPEANEIKIFTWPINLRLGRYT